MTRVPDRKAYGKQQAMPMMKEASGLEVQAKAFAYADYCTISFRVVPISILHQMTTSMSSSPACRIAIGTHVHTQLSTLKMNSSGGPRVVGWHELTNGQGGAARGGQASAGTEDTSCARSCVRRARSPSVRGAASIVGVKEARLARTKLACPRKPEAGTLSYSVRLAY